VGHVERFNPAVGALREILPELDPIAVAARRQGPPVDRASSDSAAMDLMIHDIDILLTVAESPVRSVSAVAAGEGQHICAQLAFESGLVGTLTASRLTQQKIRDLAITARECQVDVDYLDRSVEIHRHSMPEFLVDGGDIRYRHESIIERPTIENGEPLKAELSAFVDTVREGTEPPVTAADGIRAVELARRVEEECRAGAEAGVTRS
jgi:predicted dehydrogenase